MATTAEKLQEARTRAGMTVPDLARAIGASEATIVKWIYGRVEPPNAQLRKVARVLGVSITALVGEDDSSKLDKRCYPKTTENPTKT